MREGLSTLDHRLSCQRPCIGIHVTNSFPNFEKYILLAIIHFHIPNSKISPIFLLSSGCFWLPKYHMASSFSFLSSVQLVIYTVRKPPKKTPCTLFTKITHRKHVQYICCMSTFRMCLDLGFVVGKKMTSMHKFLEER